MIHFFGFKDDRIHSAIAAFGRPDFYHRYWDGRAKSMIADGDIAIFADGSDQDIPQMYSFDDSSVR
jgi:hypothetical protein